MLVDDEGRDGAALDDLRQAVTLPPASHRCPMETSLWIALLVTLDGRSLVASVIGHTSLPIGRAGAKQFPNASRAKPALSGMGSMRNVTCCQPER